MLKARKNGINKPRRQRHTSTEGLCIFSHFHHFLCVHFYPSSFWYELLLILYFFIWSFFFYLRIGGSQVSEESEICEEAQQKELRICNRGRVNVVTVFWLFLVIFFIFLICSVFTLIEMSWKLIAINLVILKVTMVFCWKV